MATTSRNITASLYVLPFEGVSDCHSFLIIASTKTFAITGNVKSQETATLTISGTIAGNTDTFTISGTLFDTEQTRTFNISGNIGPTPKTFSISGQIPELISAFSISGTIAEVEIEFSISGNILEGDDLGTSITLTPEWEIAPNIIDFSPGWEIPEAIITFSPAWEVPEGIITFSAEWEVPILTITLGTEWEINPDTITLSCQWEVRDTEQTATISIHGTVREPYQEMTFDISGEVAEKPFVLLYFDAVCANAVSKEGYTNPVWKNYIWYEGNPQRDLQLYAKNVGRVNITQVFLESVFADGSGQTWTKVALTQGELDVADQSVDIGSLDAGEIKSFWIRSLVPLTTPAPQTYRSAFLRARQS